MNIFIEGLQGTGKTTLLNRLTEALPDHHAYREGDVCLVELAWCAYLTEAEFAAAQQEFPDFSAQMRQLAVYEAGRVILPYTRVQGDGAFFQAMEQHEIYNGRIALEEFCEIILRRYAAYQGEKSLFECAFLQNTLETMLLYYCLEEDVILDFYRKVWSVLKTKSACILYLDAADIRRNLEMARKERVDEQGREIWFAMLMDFFRSAPLAKKHAWSSFDDLMKYMQLRQRMERRILTDIVGDSAVILPEKEYRLRTVLDVLQNRP